MSLTFYGATQAKYVSFYGSSTWNLVCSVDIPLNTVSVNAGEKLYAQMRRKKAQRGAVELYLSRMQGGLLPITLPCLVVLNRLAPRKLDTDNLVGAFKVIRDCVADYLRPGFAPGHADGTDQIKWNYEQMKSSEKSIKIDFYKLEIPQA